MVRRMSDLTVRYAGRYLEFRETEEKWEYVVRSNAKGCVAIAAVNEENQIVLIEQHRPPVGCKVIELPAGLAGDIPLQEDEPLETAAQRELKEETGYIARNWAVLSEGPSSAGLADEVNTIFHASGLTRVNEGGGSHGEDIRIHHVRLTDVISWCADRQAEGKMIDLKIFAAVYLVENGRGSAKGRLWY